MSWRDLDMYPDFILDRPGRPSPGTFQTNEQCFIRKEHRCGKVFGASKSCFIACPTNDELEPILGLMSEKLAKIGIEPIIAVKERAYGQDIFCTKICGKIIESRFCIVILDDTVRDGMNIPNPNVYYEYGLMTALRKHIVPLQKDDLELAFNIQSYDTIKYNSRNIAAEIDRAIRDAIRLTDAKEQPKDEGGLSIRQTLRTLELAGFEAKDEKWVLSDAIDDTGFRGFGQHERGFYLLLGRIDSEQDEASYIDDLRVVIYRVDKKSKEVEKELSGLLEYKKQQESESHRMAERERSRDFFPDTIRGTSIRGRGSIESEIRERKERLQLFGNIYIAFVNSATRSIQNLLDSVSREIATHPRFKLANHADHKLTIDGVTVEFCGQGER